MPLSEMPHFWHAFVPLFVALDGIGLMPMFWGLAGRLEPAARRRAATEAVLTALIISIGFLLVGGFAFQLMTLELADVMVAGGLILIVLCLRELLRPQALPQGEYVSPGVVPLGVPLLAGPAVLTTVLLVRQQYGWEVTLIALVANIVIVWMVLGVAGWLMQRLRREGAEVISKIANLILTAFGVMLIRRGVLAMLGGS